MPSIIESDNVKWKEAYSEKRAEEYDRFIHLGAMNYRGALTAVVEMVMAPHDAPLRFLELGTGTGILSELLLERFPRAVLTGVDGSPQMLRRARSRLVPYGERARLVVSSFEDFVVRELDGGVYDIVVSSFSLHHMAHIQLRECYVEAFRRLAPGGRLVVADYVLTRYPALQRRYEDIWVETRVRNVREALGKALDKTEAWREHEAIKRAEGDNPAVLDDQLLWLRQTGFENVDCHWKHFCYAVFGGRKPV